MGQIKTLALLLVVLLGSFSVGVQGTEVRVEINGKHVTTTTVRRLQPGRWGVSVQAGSGSIWLDLARRDARFVALGIPVATERRAA